MIMRSGAGRTKDVASYENLEYYLGIEEMCLLGLNHLLDCILCPPWGEFGRV